MPSSLTTTLLLGAIALAVAGVAAVGICVIVIAATIWEFVTTWPTTP